MIVVGFLALVLMTGYLSYLIYMAVGFGKIPPPATMASCPRVTVIVPARNEAAQIGACLKALLNQNYADYEIIVVDDHSEDATVQVAEEVGKNAPRLTVLTAPKHEGVAFKKRAVAHAIERAKGEIIVTTDADCEMGTDWLTTLVSYFSEDTGLVSGPVALTGSSIFQQMQALEFMGLIAIGAGAIAHGKPHLCNGANLAYRKAVFEEVGGFSGIDHIASGDDELLLHKIHHQGNWKVRFAKDRRAIVRTPALTTWSQFRAQRIRWVSKSTVYENKSVTLVLVLAYLTMLLLPVLTLLGFWYPEAWFYLGGAFGLKILGEGLILGLAANFFGNLHLLRWLLPEQFLHVAYVLWVGIAGNRKTYTWKGRTVR